MNFGIAGIGTYIPKKYMSYKKIGKITGVSQDIIKDKLGIKKKVIPDINETTSYMGLEAAKKAIANSGINVTDINVVIWIGGQYKDHPSWIASIKIANELGIKKAWTFDVSALCCSTMLGIELAKSILFMNNKYKNVLLVSGTRDVDFVDLQDIETSFLFDLGEGGSAIVIRKNYNKNIILESSFIYDGNLSEACIVKYKENSKKFFATQRESKNLFFSLNNNVEYFKKYLAEKSLDNFKTVINNALKESKLNCSDIDYLALLHMKKSAHYACLNAVGLSNDKSIYLDEYGHIGQNDQILSVELGLKLNKIKNNDIVVMVGAGLGFIWGATVIKWGI